MNEIQELYDTLTRINISDSDRHELLRVIDKAKAAHSRRNRILELIKDNMAELRLDMKYLVFDLEATRRERDKALKNG